MAGELLCGHGLMEVYLPCGVTSPDGMAVWMGAEERGEGHGDKGATGPWALTYLFKWMLV